MLAAAVELSQDGAFVTTHSAVVTLSPLFFVSSFVTTLSSLHCCSDR